MLLLVICVLNALVLGRTVEEGQQHTLMFGSPGAPGEVLGGSIVRLCPESSGTDILAVERIMNTPQVPYLDERGDVFIWGSLTRDVSEHSTVDYQISATANTGDSDELNGTFHVCDYLEKMQQPPHSSESEKACPPHKGPVFIDYAFWLADFLVAPGLWSVRFDAKTPEGDRIYCIETEFDLQCPPGYDGPECLRELSAQLI